jgi:hypothetical protein
MVARHEGAGVRGPRGWSRTTHLRLIRAALSPLSYTRGLRSCARGSGRDRTCDLPGFNRTLFPLSYRTGCSDGTRNGANLL